MNVVLPWDVQRLILSTYAHSHTPLTGLACKGWREFVCGQCVYEYLTPLLARFGLIEKDESSAPYPCTSLESILQYGGTAELVLWIRARRASERDWSLERRNTMLVFAAHGGHEHAIRVLLDAKFATDVNWAAAAAAWMGHRYIVKMCAREYGAKVEDALVEAVSGGHWDIVYRCVEKWGAQNMDDGLAEAAACGDQVLVESFLKGWGAENVNRAMARAAGQGHESLVRYLHGTWCAFDACRAMVCAARGGHASIVRLCHDEWGVTHPHAVMAVMMAARAAGQPHIVDMCMHEWGAPAL